MSALVVYFYLRLDGLLFEMGVNLLIMGRLGLVSPERIWMERCSVELCT